MLFTFQVVVDCRDPHLLADWWADGLGWAVERQDEAFIRQMIAEGHATHAETRTHRGRLVWSSAAAITHPDDPPGPEGRRILFQAVPEPKTVKNRLHLDVAVGPDRLESESERFIGLGATFQHRGRQGPAEWITLIDPEGNEFCIH